MTGIDCEGWRAMALVEVSQDTPDIGALLRDPALRFRLIRASAAPRGYHRYELLIDTHDGIRRAARTTWAVLVALNKAAATGILADFRIIDGGQWLALGDNNAAMGADGMTPENSGSG